MAKVVQNQYTRSLALGEKQFCSYSCAYGRIDKKSMAFIPVFVHFQNWAKRREQQQTLFGETVSLGPDTLNRAHQPGIVFKPDRAGAFRALLFEK